MALALCVGLFARTVRAEMHCFRPDGKIPEVTEIVDDEIAFAKHAETATVVAFDRIPRPNILHSWKSLGVTVLKTVRADPEMSPERFRREAGFRAFNAGADGLYLPVEPDGEWARALAEAKTDWKLLEYAKGLWEKARASEDGIIRTEGRRAMFFLQGFFPCDWENLDTLRLECTAWAKRLEQVLGLPPADLPTTLPAKPLPDYAKFRPYADRPDSVTAVKIAGPGRTAPVKGLSFAWDNGGFSVTFETHAGRALANRDDAPGGALDFRLYLPGREPGEWMPYRYHCDLNPFFKGETRAPAVGLSAYLFGTDERFVPYAHAYGVKNRRIGEWPCLRSHGPDCPDLRPSFALEPVKGGGYRATLSVAWLCLYGRWPMLGGKSGGNAWYVGVDRAPGTDAPIALKLQWPKSRPAVFTAFCDKFSTLTLTDIYREELARTLRWTSGLNDHYYEFVRTKEPTFNIGDYASDEMFRTRLVQPLVDANADLSKMIWTDRDHKPTFRRQPVVVQRSAYKMLGRMIYLSNQVGLLRRDYLVGRFAGREPPEPKAKAEDPAPPKGPDADYDEDALQLDDKEF